MRLQGGYQVCELTQPWVIYDHGRFHDRWWPVWTSTKILGRATLGMECAVCGAFEKITHPVPRCTAARKPVRHPRQLRFLVDHAHPDRGDDPLSWARPMANLDVVARRGAAS